MRFATLTQELGLEPLLDGEREVIWLEAGGEARPAIVRGGIWLTHHLPDGLIEHLARREASGLWCRTGETEDLVKACRALGLGLALLPPWLELEAALAKAREHLALNQLPATLGIAALLETMIAQMPRERDLLELLHGWLKIPLALIAPWGDLLAWAGAVPPRHPKTPGEGSGYLALSAGEGLLVAYGSPKALAPYRGMLELAVRLFTVRALEERAQRADEEGLKGALLDDLLLGEADPERARAFGFEARLPFVLALLEAAPILGRHRLAEARRRETLSHLRQGAASYLERLGVPYLLSERGGRALVLWQTYVPEGEVQALSRAMKEDVRIGYSAPHGNLAEVPQAYREALIALKTARLGQSAGFSQLDPVAWVLLQQSAEDLKALVERFLPLPKVLERTLEVYLEAEGDARAVAEALHIHPNTLRYRLHKVEEALGLSLKSPEALGQIYLALRAKGLLEEER